MRSWVWWVTWIWRNAILQSTLILRKLFHYLADTLLVELQTINGTPWLGKGKCFWIIKYIVLKMIEWCRCQGVIGKWMAILVLITTHKFCQLNLLSGAFRGSAYCPRTLWHVNWRSQASNQSPSIGVGQEVSNILFLLQLPRPHQNIVCVLACVLYPLSLLNYNCQEL